MKKIKLLLLLFLFTYNISNAQFGMSLKNKAKDVNIIKNTTLLVVLKDIDDPILKKQFKKTEIENLAEYVENYNKTLKESFTNDWTFTKEIKFINKNELKDYKKNKNKYSYFISTKKGKTAKHQVKENLIHYEIFLTGKKSPTFSFIYNEYPMTNADFRFLIQQSQLIFEGLSNYASMGKINKKMRKEGMAKFKENRNLIKSKILLINSNELTKKVIAKLKGIYPYKLEIADKNKVDKVIMEKNSEYLYLKVVQLGQIDQVKSYKSKNLNVHSLNSRFSVRIFNPKDGNQLIIPPMSGSKIVNLSTMKGIIKQIK